MQLHKFIIAVIFLIFSFCSNTQSQIWEKTSDSPSEDKNIKVTHAYENGNSEQIVYVTAANGDGIFKSTDRGANWKIVGLGGKTLTAFLDNSYYDLTEGVRHNEGEWIVTASDGVYKTTDGGENWAHYDTGIEGLYITDIIKSPENELLIGTVGNGVFHSKDGGETWEPFGIGIEYENISDIEFVYGTEEDDGLYVTTDINGAWSYDFTLHKWYAINDGNDNLVGDRAIAGDTQGNLYLATIPNIYSSPRFPAINWKVETEFGAPYDIVITPDDQVFVSGYNDGVKQRESFGVWVDFSDGLVSDNGYIDVANIDLDPNGYIWALVTPLNPSVTGGVYVTINPITNVNDNVLTFPDDYQLMQNYPNPFNPTTKIDYQIQKESFVTLKIYDVLGNEIETLLNEEESAGNYEITWDAANHPSGVYCYQLNAGGFVETKKMLLLK